MPANFLAKTRGVKDPPLVTVAQVAFPSGSGGTHYVASEPFQNYRQDVLEGGFGAVPEAVGERPHGLSPLNFQLRLGDPDAHYTKILEGQANPRRSRVVCKLAHPDLDEDDWFTFFDGIYDSPVYGSREVTLHCKTDDLALKAYIPHAKLLKGSWQGAPETEYGTLLPVVLGVHDAQGLTGTGMMPTVRLSVDATLGYKYGVTLGVAKSVPRVYKNGALQTVTTHYTVGQESRGGATLTVISMVQATVDSDVITCDVEGLTDDGTASGNVIADPTEQLKWTIENLIYGDWRGGTYSSGAPIDFASFAKAQAYTSAFGYEGSKRWGGTKKKIRGEDAVNDWLGSHPMFRLHWTIDGKLRLAAFDHRFSGYADPVGAVDVWLDGDRDEIGFSFEYAKRSAGLAAQVSLEYLYGEADGKYWQTLDVQDLERWQAEPSEENFSLSHSAARFQ